MTQPDDRATLTQAQYDAIKRQAAQLRGIDSQARTEADARVAAAQAEGASGERAREIMETGPAAEQPAPRVRSPGVRRRGVQPDSAEQPQGENGVTLLNRIGVNLVEQMAKRAYGLALVLTIDAAGFTADVVLPPSAAPDDEEADPEDKAPTYLDTYEGEPDHLGDLLELALSSAVRIVAGQKE
jgi:hypothetical protein